VEVYKSSLPRRAERFRHDFIPEHCLAVLGPWNTGQMTNEAAR